MKTPSHQSIIAPLVVALAAAIPAWGTVHVTMPESTINDAEALSHQFQIVWSSANRIDPDSLGNDDILLGSPTLFDLQLGSGAIHPHLINVQSNNDGKEIIATYQFDRPEDGWGSWGIERLRVDAVPNAVSDLSGAQSERAGLGRIFIDLDEVPQITFRLRETPIINHDTPEFLLTVIYQANYALDPALFENHQIRLTTVLVAIGDADEAVTEGWLSFPPNIVLHIDATAETVVPNESSETMTVTYRAQRPPAGWRGAEDLTVRLTPSTLGENYRLTLHPGSTNRLGTVRINNNDNVSAKVLPTTEVAFNVESITFDVTFVASSAIDLSTLGDDDLGIGPFTPFDIGIQVLAKFVEVVATENDGHVVTARYSIDQPEGGWREVGARTTLRIDAEAGGVRTVDGAILTSGHIGNIVFDAESPAIANQLVALDQWIRDLDALLEEDVTATSDQDNDGVEDVLEHLTGTDPLNPADASGLNIEINRENASPYLDLEYRHRVNIREVMVMLEGSEDGEQWQPVRQAFARIGPTVADESGLRPERLRAPVSSLPHRFFRLRLVPAS